VAEEKLDGANCGISFTGAGELKLQSRGHYLTGGPRERQFTPLKSWAATVAPVLWPVLGSRYVLYGEWLYARHTAVYDRLPHYFLEFDILDLDSGDFLATPQRHEMLAGTPVRSVPVLKSGTFGSLSELTSLIGPSLYGPDLMEGLYLKVEEQGRVVERYKWVRAGFHQEIVESGSHWADRPITPNQLADPGVMYANL
jgi:hypothetical protein